MSEEEEYSDIQFERPVYALLIGISIYKKLDKEKDYPDISEDQFKKIVKQKQIGDLNFAAQDAEDFYGFFTHRGVPEENIKCITDDEATLSGINDAFAELRTKCTSPGVKGTNPLVVVFFSGHATNDVWGWHYLLPHDATKDTLYKTGFKNPDFALWLRELGTENLIVLLDACHSGSFGEDGKSESQEGVPEYEYKGLGEGEGQAILASCKPLQKSYEFEQAGRKNGIFSGCLLDLLKLKTDDFSDNEEITTTNIYNPLMKYVEKAAHPKEQTPFWVKQHGTGIVLAINRRAQKQRIEKDKLASQKKQKLLDHIRDSKLITKPPILNLLGNYIARGVKIRLQLELYEHFDWYIGDLQWDSQNRDFDWDGQRKEEFDQNELDQSEIEPQILEHQQMRLEEICSVLDSCYQSSSAPRDNSRSGQIAGAKEPAAAAPVSQRIDRQRDGRMEPRASCPALRIEQKVAEPSVSEGSQETSAEAPMNVVELRAE